MSQLPDPDPRRPRARLACPRRPACAPCRERIDCDVAIVGSGAGAGITAELLTQAGLKVVIVEEGPLRSSTDFHQRESEAYPALYQESAGAQDGRQGHQHPAGALRRRLDHGQLDEFVPHADAHARPLARALRADRLRAEALAPWFQQAERRLNIGPWLMPPEREQRAAAPRRHSAGHHRADDPAQRQGLLEPRLLRHGLPDQCQAVDAGDDDPGGARPRRDAAGADACRALELEGRAHRGAALRAGADQRRASGATASRASSARHYVVAGGAINSPALLLRSERARPARRCSGARTFLHPVVISAALFDQRDRRLEWRAADDLQRPLPRDAADRRPDRLQARGAAACTR